MTTGIALSSLTVRLLAGKMREATFSAFERCVGLKEKKERKALLIALGLGGNNGAPMRIRPIHPLILQKV